MFVVPLLYCHFDGFIPQKWQEVGGILDKDMMVEGSESYAVICNGGMIAAGGIITGANHIAAAWALLGEGHERYMLFLTKKVAGFLDGLQFLRVQTVVKQDFDMGHKWARLLGFENETPDGMKNYTPKGETYSLYARYKNGNSGNGGTFSDAGAFPITGN